MEFCDLKGQYRAYQSEIDAAIRSVLASAAFIQGPDVKTLESELAGYCGVGHVITCANGTDALFIALRALGLGPGDEVIVPDFTFYATAEAVALAGAIPVFADIDPILYHITPATVAGKITPRTKGIIPVSLFGQIPDLEGLGDLAAKKGLWVMEDAAQSFGATRHGRASTSLTRVATTSFFPSKPLGGYGDGGAIFTSDPELAGRLRLIANHGSSQRYHHSLVGVNSRLDSLQAAVLRVKLRHFESELVHRRRAAQAYSDRLAGLADAPALAEGNTSTWAQYTLRVPERDRVRAHLEKKGIPTAIHYPLPLHAQEAFAALGGKDEDCPEAARAAREAISLPMHGLISDRDIEETCAALKEVL